MSRPGGGALKPISLWAHVNYEVSNLTGAHSGSI
jgi:hypothetical protein